MDEIDDHISAIKALDGRVKGVIVVREADDPNGKIKEYRRDQEKRTLMSFLGWLNVHGGHISVQDCGPGAYMGAADICYHPRKDVIEGLVDLYLEGEQE